MREKRQKEAFDSFSDRKTGIIHCTPRFGKTKVGLDIAMAEKGGILVAYPSNPIKESWKAEMTKWGYTGSNIDFTTFLSLKKTLKNSYGLVILDEIHALSEAQIELIRDFRKEHPEIRFLGMTGTLGPDSQDIIKRELGMSVCYRYTLEQAIAEGIVSDYEIEIISVNLDNSVPKYQNKKKSTWNTEKQQFDQVSRTIVYLENTNKNVFFKRLERMRIIQNSLAKLKETQKLLKNAQNERLLVFCGTMDISDSIGCLSYHSRSNEEQTFNDFCRGKGNHLAVCKMLNMGVTIKNLDRVVFNYFNSNEETFIQQLNRCMNYDYSGKIAKITIICTTEEVERAWLRKALKPLEKSKIKWK